MTVFDELGLRNIYEFQEQEEVEEPDTLASIQVRCKYDCGFFYLSDVEFLEFNADSPGAVTFRCPSCNELQTGSYVLID